MGVGVLEMRELKSVTVGIWWRGWWDVIWFSRDKQELEVQVVKDSVVDGSEVLKFELGVLGTESLEESDFIVMQERPLEDVSNPLMLLCMCWQVVNVAGNGGLIVR